MRRYGNVTRWVLAASVSLLPAGIAHADTCADLDGDGIAETCVPSNDGSSGNSGYDNSDKPDYAQIRQERYDAAWSYNSTGEWQLANGNYAAAIVSFKEALRWWSDNTFRRNLAFAEGQLAWRNRDYATALAKFNRAVSLDPANAAPVRAAMREAAIQANHDGVRRYYAGDLAGALKLFKLANSLTPGVEDVLYNIAVTEAEIAAGKGKFGSAATMLNTLEAKHPEFRPKIEVERDKLGGLAMNVANAELESGDRNGATKAYKDVLALTPDNTLARERLDLLTTRPKGQAKGWQVFYSGTARDMFGAQGRGDFASLAECEAYNRSRPPFEQRQSSCVGPPPPTNLGEGEAGGGQQQAGTGYVQPASGSTATKPKPGQAQQKPQTSQNSKPNPAQQQAAAAPVDPAKQPLPVLPWRSADFAPPSQAAQSACMLGTTAAQNAVRRGDLAYAAEILKVAIPGCRGGATRTLLEFRLLEIENEIDLRAKRATYTPVPTGLIGGTTWMFEDVHYDLASLSPEERAQADANLKARFKAAGMTTETYMVAKDYEFVLGLAVSRYESVDLVNRVVFDNEFEGEFSRQTRAQYSFLTGKHFDVLDCHSNGAMICLAALRNGDVTADKVRLFGPQLSPDAIREWRKLLDKGGFGNKIGELQVVIADGDPIPASSYLLAARIDGQDPAFADTMLGKGLEERLREPMCEMDGLMGCYALPEPQVIRLGCRGSTVRMSISVCHPISRYRKDLDALERK